MNIRILPEIVKGVILIALVLLASYARSQFTKDFPAFLVASTFGVLLSFVFTLIGKLPEVG